MNESEVRSVSFSQTNRQIEHIVPIAFAFLLRWLPPWGAVGMAALGVIYAIYVSPRLVPSGLREEERNLRCIPAKLLYALAVLLLVIVFCNRLHIAAGAWAMLSVGDGCASLVGTRWGARRLPWNGGKSWIGLAAFISTGWAGATILLLWIGPRYPQEALSGPRALGAALVAALVAGLVESLPLGRWLDDNLSVPLTAALILACLI